MSRCQSSSLQEPQVRCERFAQDEHREPLGRKWLIGAGQPHSQRPDKSFNTSRVTATSTGDVIGRGYNQVWRWHLTAFSARSLHVSKTSSGEPSQQSIRVATKQPQASRCVAASETALPQRLRSETSY
ncbi:uncharacterized [Tachysurus ichikawai]